MLRKDQKGYVMSGLGLLLLIPVMIIIPIFLAVETQSSDLPNQFTQSDTAYRSYLDIKTDLRNQIFILGSKINNQTFNSNQYGIINSAVGVLYTSTQSSKYQNAYGGSVNVNIKPKFSPTIVGSWNETGGTVYLNNGYIINFVNNTPIYKDPKSNYYLCNYTMAVSANVTISVTESAAPNNGHTQDYIETYLDYFVVNSNQTTLSGATQALGQFFGQLKSNIPTNYYT